MNKAQFFIKKIFAPEYSELSLFIMGYTCLLFLSVNISFIEKIKLNATDNNLGVLIIFLIILAGILLSIIHAFIKRRKTSVEKFIMLFFAVLLNGFCGLWAGTYFLGQTKGVLLILPIWNIFSSYMLISSIRKDRYKGINESRISNENVKFIEALIGALIATGIFFTSKYYLHHVWAVTLSFCIVFATNFSVPIVSLITGISKLSQNSGRLA